MFFGCRLLVGDRHADYSIIKGQPSSLTVSEGRILIKKKQMEKNEKEERRRGESRKKEAIRSFF